MNEKVANLPLAARILSVETDNYRTKTFTVDASLPAYPGQFVMVWLPGFDEKPFSLVDTDPVRVMITAVGPFTNLIHEKRPGDMLWVRGPFGHGFSTVERDSHALLVGGGYGVAPLLWLAQLLTSHVEQLTTVLGARSRDELLYVDRFRRVVERSEGMHHELCVVTDDGATGERGLVTDVAGPRLATGEVDRVYACGPHPMLAAIRDMALSFGVPCQLSWEAYMRCGMGLCGACELEGSLVCVDGPVVYFEP